MQIKTFLKKNKIKISTIAKTCNIPYTTVNEIINGKIDIDRVQIGTGLKIAHACNMQFEEFYGLCKQSYELPVIQNGKILMKNKSYYLQYDLPEATGEIYLCRINPVNTNFIKDMAEWSIQDICEGIERQRSREEVEAWGADTI